MSASQWHKLYTASIGAVPDVLFDLLADMPDYGRWLPGSTAFGSTTDVDPYPVVLDISMPLILRPLRRAITSSFDRENVRTMAALKTYAEAYPESVQRTPGGTP